MRVFFRAFIVLAAGASVVSPARAAFAQNEAPAEAVTPPRLTKFVEAPYPEQARTDGAGAAEVELEIDISETGAVKNARVTKSVGHGFDEAALGASRAFVFEPATRGGKPMPARIRYKYVFAAPVVAPPAPVAPVPPAAGAVTGKVLDRGGNLPIPGAEVLLMQSDGTAQRVVTGPTGVFRFDNVPPGAARITITAADHDPTTNDEQVESGTATDVVYRVEHVKDAEEFGATARVEAPSREVTKRSISRDEITNMPGTRGDALRAIEVLPGVNRPTTGASQPVIRGSNPNDSQVFFEGMGVPILYHFGSLTSFVNSRVLESVDFYPGNFSARYGRKTGGVVDVRMRDPRTDGFHGVVDLSVIDSSAIVETPIGDKWSVMVAGRRSNLDLFLKPLVQSSDVSITAAPVYYDYQAVVAFKPTDNDRFRLMLYGSSDRFALLTKNDDGDDPSLVGNFDTSTEFYRAQVGWRHRFSSSAEQNTEIAVGTMSQTANLGTFLNSHFATKDVMGRSEWSFLIRPEVRLIAGVDVTASRFSGSYDGVAPSNEEGGTDESPGASKKVQLTDSFWLVAPAGYLEASLRPVKPLLLVPGVRFDYFDQNKQSSVDPRISARLDVTESTTLKGGVGRFSQAPEYYQVLDGIGNPDLKLTHALHTSVGVEQKIGDSTTVSAEGFYKWIDGIPIATDGGRAPYFTNDQVGRVYGMELSAHVKPTGRFYGFLSYTLMRSERRATGEDWRLFDQDQTHIFSAVGVYRLGRGWELGATARYSSGVPYAPVIGNSYDANTDIYRARYGAISSARNPSFYRLDVRVEKKWTFSKWALATYLDVQNVTNSPNREGFSYNYDYTIRQGALGLPLLPSLGLRGEF